MLQGGGLAPVQGQAFQYFSFSTASLTFRISVSLVCLSGTESFGLFSCVVNGEEREQTHRAVFRYINSLGRDCPSTRSRGPVYKLLRSLLYVTYLSQRGLKSTSYLTSGSSLDIQMS